MGHPTSACLILNWHIHITQVLQNVSNATDAAHCLPNSDLLSSLRQRSSESYKRRVAEVNIALKRVGVRIAG